MTSFTQAGTDKELNNFVTKWTNGHIVLFYKQRYYLYTPLKYQGGITIITIITNHIIIIIIINAEFVLM